ncbi:hypothetical protein GQ457_18G007290 [Hibiscus cannabinus]
MELEEISSVDSLPNKMGNPPYFICKMWYCCDKDDGESTLASPMISSFNSIVIDSTATRDVKSGTRLGFRSGHFRSGKIGYRSFQVDLTFRLESGRVQVRFRSGSFQVGSVSGRVHFRSGSFQVGFVPGRVISGRVRSR